MMEIRLTELKDLPLVMEIYDYARAFMRANGLDWHIGHIAYRYEASNYFPNKIHN